MTGPAPLNPLLAGIAAVLVLLAGGAAAATIGGVSAPAAGGGSGQVPGCVAAAASLKASPVRSMAGTITAVVVTGAPAGCSGTIRVTARGAAGTALGAGSAAVADPVTVTLAPAVSETALQGWALSLGS